MYASRFSAYRTFLCAHQICCDYGDSSWAILGSYFFHRRPRTDVFASVHGRAGVGVTSITILISNDLKQLLCRLRTCTMRSRDVPWDRPRGTKFGAMPFLTCPRMLFAQDTLSKARIALYRSLGPLLGPIGFIAMRLKLTLRAIFK